MFLPLTATYTTLIISCFLLAKMVKINFKNDFQVYWKEKLRYKWGNERKSRDKHMPEVQARKRTNEDKVQSKLT